MDNNRIRDCAVSTQGDMARWNTDDKLGGQAQQHTPLTLWNYRTSSTMMVKSSTEIFDSTLRSAMNFYWTTALLTRLSSPNCSFNRSPLVNLLRIPLLLIQSPLERDPDKQLLFLINLQSIYRRLFTIPMLLHLSYLFSI